MDTREMIPGGDVSEILRLLTAQAETIKRLEARIAALESEKANLQEEVRFLRSCVYGRKTEKTSALGIGQHLLFNNIQEIIGQAPANEPEKIEIRKTGAGKRKRGLFPPGMPVEEVVIDLPEEEKRCACGCMKTRIGEETSLRADYVPGRSSLRKTTRPKYACKRCRGEDDEGPVIAIAPLPPSILGKFALTERLVAHVITSKYMDALPLYRQEKIFKRIGLEIGRATMASSVIKAHENLLPLQRLMEKKLLTASLIGIDESRFHVMNEPGRSNKQLSYMWQFRAGARDGPFSYFLYRETHEAKFLNEFLAGYEGPIVTDGYGGYDRFGRRPGIIHAGCNAHARRKFVQAEEVSPGNPFNAKIIVLYRDIYAVERALSAANAGPEIILEHRRQKSKPLMLELRETLEELLVKAESGSKIAAATNYTLGEWPKLIRFLDDPRIPIDNNDVEREFRSFAVGRKNWLFANTPRGARASAFYFSLMSWCKDLELDASEYMVYLFENAGAAVTDGDWEALLPCNFDHVSEKRNFSQGVVS